MTINLCYQIRGFSVAQIMNLIMLTYRGLRFLQWFFRSFNITFTVPLPFPTAPWPFPHRSRLKKQNKNNRFHYRNREREREY